MAPCNLKNPDTANLCYVSVGDYAPGMTGFCAAITASGEAHRRNNCREMSTGGEWGNYRKGDECCYNSIYTYQKMSCVCCIGDPLDGDCSVPGRGVECQRTAFSGDPVTCCFKDLACNNDGDPSAPAACFSDAAKQNTCSDGQNGQPDHRSLVSSGCQDVMLEYCTGTLPTDDPNSTDWIERWTTNSGGTGSCNYILQRNVFAVGGTGHCFIPTPTPTPGVCNLPTQYPLDSAGFFWGQRLINAAVAKYTSQGFRIGTLPGLPGYNPWQDYLYYNVCCPISGLCQEALTNTCADRTAQRISLNPAVAQWCGCHLPVGEYEDYSVKFNIPPQCSPSCNRFGTIPITDGSGQPIRCKQDICLIDNVTVNLVNAQIGNGIDFNQMCDNCGGGQCSCIVSDTTVDLANSTIGGNYVPIGQGCGNLTCNQTNPGTTGPFVIPVSCSATGPFNPYAEYEAEVDALQAKARKTSWFWTMLIVVGGLLVVFFILLIIHPVYKAYV
jgi:hypothetical protein